ncbi:hypothetical protein OHV10_06945 [Vibrio splendidus]|uniref:hypothetical protein n=1 Tax=Vibrio splendidus TaxID=29497 RepID=UPI00223670ED|nr:hypothetical protein [Vibrio splendidus]MCW4444013.1 hypothetical protein [Vibrio splendidus]
MDTSDLIVDYSESDFADSIRSLLPKGEYWQEAENQELTRLIEGMAQDFKVTHDEVELSLLAELKDDLFGWKISDYQALLFEVAGKQSGTVYDEVAEPNLIYVSLKPSSRSSAGDAWKAFEDKRLPHTDIQWLYNNETTLYVQAVNYQFTRNIHQYEICPTFEHFTEVANARHVRTIHTHEVTQ